MGAGVGTGAAGSEAEGSGSAVSAALGPAASASGPRHGIALESAIGLLGAASLGLRDRLGLPRRRDSADARSVSTRSGLAEHRSRLQPWTSLGSGHGLRDRLGLLGRGFGLSRVQPLGSAARRASARGHGPRPAGCLGYGVGLSLGLHRCRRSAALGLGGVGRRQPQARRGRPRRPARLGHCFGLGRRGLGIGVSDGALRLDLGHVRGRGLVSTGREDSDVSTSGVGGLGVGWSSVTGIRPSAGRRR